MTARLASSLAPTEQPAHHRSRLTARARARMRLGPAMRSADQIRHADDDAVKGRQRKKAPALAPPRRDTRTGASRSSIYSSTASSHTGTTHRGDTSAPHRPPIRAVREPGMRKMSGRPRDCHSIPERTRRAVEHRIRHRQAAPLTPRLDRRRRLPQPIRQPNDRENYRDLTRPLHTGHTPPASAHDMPSICQPSAAIPRGVRPSDSQMCRCYCANHAAPSPANSRDEYRTYVATATPYDSSHCDACGERHKSRHVFRSCVVNVTPAGGFGTGKSCSIGKTVTILPLFAPFLASF